MSDATERAKPLVKQFEGLSLKPYFCPAEIWTIGYGSTQGVGPNSRAITQEEAERRLAADLATAERFLDRVVEIPLTINQRAALISFIYNVGPGKKNVKDGFVTLKNGKPSTMLTKINAGDFEGAAAEFDKWVKADGKSLSGLKKRRAVEKALFLRQEGEPALKPLSQSRTVKASKAAIGAGTITTVTASVAAVAPAVPVVQSVAETAHTYPLGIIIALGIVIIAMGGYFLWLRIDDHKKAKR